MPEPDREQAERDRADNVAARLQPFSVIGEIERLQAERRESGVTPHRPIMTNWRKVELAKMRPSGPVRVAKKPMMREPVIFTNSVPQGKVSPNIRAANPVHQ